jgi:hypothetical protein
MKIYEICIVHVKFMKAHVKCIKARLKCMKARVKCMKFVVYTSLLTFSAVSYRKVEYYSRRIGHERYALYFCSSIYLYFYDSLAAVRGLIQNLRKNMKQWLTATRKEFFPFTGKMY